MATITQLRDRIKVRISRRTGGATLNTQVVDALDVAQVDILERSPTLPNYLSVEETLTGTGAHSTLDLSTTTRTHIRPWPLEALWWLDTTVSTGDQRKQIYRGDSLALINQINPGEATEPKRYWWDGNEQGVLELRPFVTATLSYKYRFYGADSEIPSAPGGDDITLWSKNDADLLMHTAGLEVAQYLRDQAAITYFSQKRQEAHQRFIRRVQAQLDADNEYIMGDD